MKNTMKFLGIIALVAIMGFSMTGCPNDDDGGVVVGGGGTFTLTDIPREYNGKYAWLSCNIKDLCGFQSYSGLAQKYTLSKISNGSVRIPIWIVYEKSNPRRAPLGNTFGDTTYEYIAVSICNSKEKGRYENIDPIARVRFSSVTVSSSSLKKSWNDGTVSP
jgi:hypothetical protein